MSKLQRLPASTGDAEASPIAAEKLISGNPTNMLNNMFTNTKENFFCGVWSSTEGKWELNYTEDEFCYIISGKAIITDAEGHSETVVAGDAFTISAGFSGSWETIGEVKKFYAIYEE